MKPKPQIDLTTAGEEAKKLFAEDAAFKDMRGAREQRKLQLKKLLPLIWSALEAGETVNGCATKEEWCKFAGCQMRTVQYIVYGRKKKDETNNVRPNLENTYLDFSYDNHKTAKRLTMLMDFNIAAPNGVIANDTDVRLRVSVAGTDTRETYDAAIKEMTKLMKQTRLWNEKSAADFKAGVEGYFKEVEVPAKPKPVEGAHGTNLRIEAAHAAYGEKKVSKKVFERIFAGVSKYLQHLRTQQPPVPERPENATVVCEGDDNPSPSRGRGMIISRSPEYEGWEAACSAAYQTPEYVAWNNERAMICELESALIQRYDPVMEGDLDGDDDPNGAYEEEVL